MVRMNIDILMFVRACVCVCVCVCVGVCRHVCVCVSHDTRWPLNLCEITCVCVTLCMHVNVAYICLYIRACVWNDICLCIHVSMQAWVRFKALAIAVCIFCMCVCVSVCSFSIPLLSPCTAYELHDLCQFNVCDYVCVCIFVCIINACTAVACIPILILQWTPTISNESHL